jgi:hypothetical protein
MRRVKGRNETKIRRMATIGWSWRGWICLINCHSFNNVMAALPRTAARGRKKTGLSAGRWNAWLLCVSMPSVNVPSVLCGRIDGSGLA